jgi:hypothetical protein
VWRAFWHWQYYRKFEAFMPQAARKTLSAFLSGLCFALLIAPMAIAQQNGRPGILYINGNLVARVEPDGTVFKNGYIMGAFHPDGRIIEGNAVVGTMDAQGGIYRIGVEIGRVEATGWVYKKGLLVGRVDLDGNVLKDGILLATSENLLPARAAALAFFFFQEN